MSWQPIDTAPQGTLVIVYIPKKDRVCLASYELDGGETIDGHVVTEDWWQWVDIDAGMELHEDDDNLPSHWMPFQKPEESGIEANAPRHSFFGRSIDDIRFELYVAIYQSPDGSSTTHSEVAYGVREWCARCSPKAEPYNGWPKIGTMSLVTKDFEAL